MVVVSDADPRVKRRDGTCPVEEIEKEFEASGPALADEFFEVGLQGFLTEVFEREVPNWRDGGAAIQGGAISRSGTQGNKAQLEVKRGQGVPEGRWSWITAVTVAGGTTPSCFIRRL